jgi:23S rRNA (pseudouridine1915-N3)-methyltransferase
VRLHIAWIGRTKSTPIQSLTAEYLKRLTPFASCDAHELASEAALLKLLEKSTKRTKPVLVLLDSRGQQLTSVGPADGWSDEMRKGAGTVLSFGKITLPHELARVVLLEQLYRGFTILKGHPYHGGH